MNFARFALKDLFVVKARLFLTLSGIAVGIAAMTAMLGISDSVRSSIKSLYSGRPIDIIAFEKDEFTIISSRVPVSVLDRLRSLPEIAEAEGLIFDFCRYKRSYLPLYGIPSGSAYNDLLITKGRRPSDGTNEAMAGEMLARTSGIEPGARVNLKCDTFTITGAFSSPSPIENSAFMIPLDTFQKMDADKKDTVVGIHIRLKDAYNSPFQVAAVIKKIDRDFPELTAQSVSSYISERMRFILVGDQISKVIALITIIAVVLGLANIMMVSVFEKKKFLAMLIALGWRKTEIIRLILTQSIILTALGGIAGAFLGHAALEHIFRTMSVGLYKPMWTVPFIEQICGIILVTALAAAAIPLWLIVNMNPVEVIKSE